MKASLDYRLKRDEKVMVRLIIETTVGEIETKAPGAIARHPEEVSAIFKEVVQRKTDEAEKEKWAKRRAADAAWEKQKEAMNAKWTEFEESIASLSPEEQAYERMMHGPRFTNLPTTTK